MARQTVVQVARDILLNDERFNYVDFIGWGDLDILHEVFEKAGLKLKNEHPINKHQAVLNALDAHCKTKNTLFRKEYYRVYSNGARLARTFILIEKEVNDK